VRPPPEAAVAAHLSRLSVERWRIATSIGWERSQTPRSGGDALL